MEDRELGTCCLTRPADGVESIELDTVNLRMVARTLPGKQFEWAASYVYCGPRAAPAGIGRRRCHSRWWSIVHPATAAVLKKRRRAAGEKNEVCQARLGRMRFRRSC